MKGERAKLLRNEFEVRISLILASLGVSPSSVGPSDFLVGVGVEFSGGGGSITMVGVPGFSTVTHTHPHHHKFEKRLLFFLPRIELAFQQI